MIDLNRVIRFKRFLVEIIINEDWEYGNGDPMSADAENFVEYCKALEDRLMAIDHVIVKREVKGD